MKIASRLQYGCTWINTHFMLVNEMPHGGLKQSGYGKDMSLYALEDYTAARHAMVNAPYNCAPAPTPSSHSRYPGFS